MTGPSLPLGSRHRVSLSAKKSAKIFQYRRPLHLLDLVAFLFGAPSGVPWHLDINPSSIYVLLGPGASPLFHCFSYSAWCRGGHSHPSLCEVYPCRWAGHNRNHLLAQLQPHQPPLLCLKQANHVLISEPLCLSFLLPGILFP